MTRHDGEPDRPVEAALRAGAAVYNAGFYHPAHDAWERRWLRAAGPTADLLQGLIQLAAAVHHAREGNDEGATGLADSARAYLANARDGGAARGVNVGAVRDYLAALEAEPAVATREPPVALSIEGVEPRLAALEFPAVGLAARALAEDTDHAALVERAVAYAERDLAADRVGSPVVALLADYCRGQAGGDPDVGPVLARLRGHVERRAQRDADVEGLFDPEED